MELSLSASRSERLAITMMLSRKRGFTLVEVLVALVVIAISLGALVESSSTNIKSVTSLRDKTLAQWVASNIVNGYQVLGPWPDAGADQGIVKMANASWRWQARIDNTLVPEIRRIEVSVVRETGSLHVAKPPYEGVSLVGFLRRDLGAE